MRIFIGVIEISNFIKSYSTALIGKGHEVFTSTSFMKKSFYKDDFDLNFSEFGLFLAQRGVIPKVNFIIRIFNKLYNRFPILFKKQIEKQIISNFDVFIFIWGLKSMLPNYKDLEIIKNNKKRIIFCLMGSDVRHPLAFQQFYNVDSTEPWGDSISKLKLSSKLFPLRKVELLSDVIFSLPDQSLLGVRPYNHLKIMVDTNLISLNLEKFQNTKITVLHMPSRPKTKGTIFINKVILKLKNEGFDFNYLYKTSVPHDRVFNYLSGAHIVVDELNGLGPGMLGYEAMASGCVVLTNSDKHSIVQTPAIRTNKENLYLNLKKMLQLKMSELMKIAETSRRYVEDYHSVDKIGSYIENAIYGELKPDYYPTFISRNFRNTFNQRIPKKIQALTDDVILSHGYIDSESYISLKNKGQALGKSLKFRKWKPSLEDKII